jgi:hypothetical protein
MSAFPPLSHSLRLASAFLSLSPVLSAQATDPVNQSELIQQLLQRIDRLEKRVSELEGSRAEQPSPAATASAQPAAMGHVHGTTIEPAISYPSLKLSGFGDLNYAASSQPGTHSSFSEGQFILHLTSALSARVAYFGELSLTARTDGGTGSPTATGFNAEVERSIIRFDQSDHFKLSFGRYHTPISYWNTEFHHGSWLQTTASRPEMIQFGGSFIPVHFVGALAEGSFSAGGLNLNYNAGLGNGRSSVLSRAGDWGDVNNSKAWLANVFIKPDQLYGLRLGAAVYRDKISVPGRPESREWITSAHIAWAKEKPEVIAEFFNVNHQQTFTGVTTNNQAWYAQVAYRLPLERWKPYYRYEYIHVPLADAVYSGFGLSMNGSNLGVRYDISSYAAFKLEWRNQNRPGLANINLFWGQTSFTF